MSRWRCWIAPQSPGSAPRMLGALSPAAGPMRSLAHTFRLTENSMAETEIAGTINVVDPHPLNWLYITWNTMEEPVRTDEKGHLSNSAMEGGHWVDNRTFEINLRRGITFQDGTTLDSGTFERAFAETQRWKAP